MKKLFFLLTFALSLSGATIVLDPGHGGKYIGTCNDEENLVEKFLTLEVTLSLADRLKALGHKVVLTRTTDTELDKDDLIVDLTKRAALTSEHAADLFLSIHFNGSLNKQSVGFEVYVPYEDKYPMKSYALASAIHYDLSHEIEPVFFGGSLGNLNVLDRGIKASRFNVLKKAACPAVLVECAYLTHAETAKKLKTDEYKDQLVCAIEKGVQRYLAHLEEKVIICKRPRCRRWKENH